MQENYIKTNSIFTSKTKQSGWVGFLSNAFITVCLILSTFMLGFTIIYDSAPVYGPSMQPTLNKYGSLKSDIVYINNFSSFTYGDIIVVKTDNSDDGYIIKRVIGMAGDTIDIKVEDDNVYVFRNGEKLIEDYILDVRLSGEPDNLGMWTTLENFKELRHNEMLDPSYSLAEFENDKLVVGENQVFVLGDNRGRSLDSSCDGPFLVDTVVGRVDYIVPYGTKPLTYFIKHFLGIKN